MSIYIYNSLTGKKEEFIPLNPPKVNMYTCGVTVYDESHIGHARSLYIFDVIRRYLKYRGYEVKFVRNITDIDDKIINRANELKLSAAELAKKYIDSYYEDIKALDIEMGNSEPKATDNIPDMIKFIQGLIDRGFAYAIDGDVYFSVRKFAGYGKLSHQSCDEMASGARIEVDERKKDPLDFALWKKSKAGEPSWDSPWGEGRPGWHIECSTMSLKYLKTDTLDIHAGGRDLIFPHHENEIAQAETLTGKPFARYWIHHGLLTVAGQKMAKSAGNFITIKDILKKYTADTLKIFFLSAHYGSSIDFTYERMDEARQALERITILLDKIDRKLYAIRYTLYAKEIDQIKGIKNKFLEAMDDDFNTARALSYVFDLVNLANKNIEDLDFIQSAKNLLLELLGVFNVSAKIDKASGGLDAKEIEDLIKARNNARANKDFATADKIRQELEAKGIIIEDEKDKTLWRRKI